MKQAIVVGCGLSGSVIARELAENGYKVRILKKEIILAAICMTMLMNMEFLFISMVRIHSTQRKKNFMIICAGLVNGTNII